jgi:hypothetical protein
MVLLVPTDPIAEMHVDSDRFVWFRGSAGVYCEPGLLWFVTCWCLPNLWLVSGAEVYGGRN